MAKHFRTEKHSSALVTWLLVWMLLAANPDIIHGSNAITTVMPVSSSDLVVHRVTVEIEADPEYQPRYAAMAKRIIGIRPGDLLTEAAVNTAVESLKLSNRFAAIHVDLIPESGNQTLVFRLKPYRYIKDIRIHGKYPLFERDILNQMTLYPGDPYTRADLSDQIKTIVKRYRREGYVDPQVSVTAEHDPGDENAIIRVKIDKGPHYRLGDLTLDGNRGISNAALKWRMRIWRSSLVPGIGRFSEYRLKKDVAEIVKYYRRRGFADANLTYEIGKPDDQYRVNVVVRIDEGRRYRIDFDGNQRFWKLTLKKDVVIFTDGNRSNTGVRKSVRNMIKRYHQAGFMDARIEARKTDLPGTPVAIRNLLFVIREGPQTLVEKIDIVGNRVIAEEEIRQQLLTRPPSLLHEGALVPETVEEDSYAVTTLYMQQGFQERRVDTDVSFNQEKTGATVVLNITEGPQTRVGTITIHGLPETHPSDVRQMLALRAGKPFSQTALDADKETLTSLVSENGYPHTEVTGDVAYSDDRTRADIVFTIAPGQHVTLGDIFISGNLRTRPKVIRRELAVQPNTPLSLRNLHDGQRQLRDLAIFHGVSYRTFGLKEKEETVNLFVEVEESKPYYAQISGGYQSDSGIFGRIAAGDRNLLGLNKDLWASGELSETGYRVETRLTEPRLFGTRTTASMGIFNEEVTEFNQPFGTRTTGGSLGFGREWADHWSTALVFSLEDRVRFSADGIDTDPAEEENRSIFVATPTMRYDSRDSFVRPTQGTYTSLRVDLSKGIQNQLDDFVRYQFDVRYYLSPSEQVTFAGLARIGQVLPYAETERVPDDQLFFLGGIRNVRGFKENLLRFDSIGDPVGGKTAFVGSLEARIDLGWNWELTTFFDVGSVRDALVDEGSDQLRASVGLGLRYITPIGPMGVLYGYKLDRQEGESAGRLHVSIGYSF